MSNKIGPHIGKNVIETLTLGMYENPRFIFREYVQNAADQIDIAVEEGILRKREDGEINVTIDSIENKIVIEDNATGIRSDKVRKFLGDVANSEKDVNKRKGFRGIGRLGGLGYCHKLIFETSSKGESVKTTMELDAKMLKEIINDIQDTRDASSVISVITKISTSKELSDSHYFRVILENVQSQDVLDIESVYKYLSIVTPVPFSSDFVYKNKINVHFKRKKIIIDEYNVRLNGTPIVKAYKNTLQFPGKPDAEITSIGFFDVEDENSQLLAVGWYGISNLLNFIIDEVNFERGIRIRKNNITIGDENTLIDKQLFKSQRTNLRYIGEIHIVGNGFIPNARRDYFNESKAVSQFEQSLSVIFSSFERKLPYQASKLHTRKKIIIDFRKFLQSYREDQNKFITSTEQEQRLDEVNKVYENAKKASVEIGKIGNEAEADTILNDLFQSVIGDFKFIVDDDEMVGIKPDRVIPPLEFSKVTSKQAEILNEVVIFLQQELGYEKATPLIKKIQKKYN